MDVKLVVTAGSKRSTVIPLRSAVTLIGRHRGCDLRIPSSLVSRRHCRLRFRDGQLLVEDLASANGSFVNGIAVEGQTVVRPGDVLEVGPVSFRVEYELATKAVQSAPKPTTLPPVRQPEPLPMVEMLPDSPEPLPMGELLPDSPVPLPVGEVISQPDVPTKTAADDQRPSQREEEAAVDDEAATVAFDDLGWKPPLDLKDILSQLEED